MTVLTITFMVATFVELTAITSLALIIARILVVQAGQFAYLVKILDLGWRTKEPDKEHKP